MRLPCKAGFWKRNTLAIGIILIATLILSGCNTPSIFTGAETGSGPCQADHQIGFIKTLHKELVDASGCQMNLTGVNWFGFETSTFAPHGLDVRNWRDMLRQIAQLGFNTIRLPYTNQLFDPASKPLGINYRLNPDLKGLQGLALMDRIIQGAGSLGVKVILDRHDPTADLRPGLGYTDQMPQSHWVADWVMLAQHYRGNATVIGADLANEPHGPATWGDGNPSTDWRMAAEQAGNAVLAANPDWLIIVEGIEQYHGDFYCRAATWKVQSSTLCTCRSRISLCILPMTTARRSMLNHGSRPRTSRTTSPPSGRSIGPICRRSGMPRCSWENSEGVLWARTPRACGNAPW